MIWTTDFTLLVIPFDRNLQKSVGFIDLLNPGIVCIFFKLYIVIIYEFCSTSTVNKEYKLRSMFQRYTICHVQKLYFYVCTTSSVLIK